MMMVMSDYRKKVYKAKLREHDQVHAYIALVILHNSVNLVWDNIQNSISHHVSLDMCIKWEYLVTALELESLLQGFYCSC